MSSSKFEIFEWETFYIVTTHKVASSKVATVFRESNGIKHFLFTPSSYESLIFEFINEIDKNKKVYFLIRNPIDRFFSSKFQEYQTDSNFNYNIGDDFETKEVTAGDIKYYNNIINLESSNLDINDIFIKYKKDSTFIKVFLAVVFHYINNNIVSNNEHNTIYLPIIYLLHKSNKFKSYLFNINNNVETIFKIEKIDTSLVGNSYINSKPDVTSFLKTELIENKYIIRLVEYEKIFYDLLDTKVI